MHGFINFFVQSWATLRISVGSIPDRAGTALVGLLGFAGVSLVLTGMLSMGEGIKATTQRNGSPDIAVIMRGGSTSEINSGFSGEATKTIANAPGVKRGAGDIAESSPEVLVVVDVPRRTTGKDSNVPFRGVTDQAYRIHDKVHVVQGRMYQPGSAEVIVGAQAAGEFAGLEVGAKRRWQGTEWTVVGIFESGGGLEESEMWTDDRTLQTAFKRGSYYQSVYVRLASKDDFKAFKDALTSNPTLNVTVQRQDEYLAAQSALLAGAVGVFGGVIAFLMGLGAVFGAINAMFSSVAARTLEIATLRALGFGRGAVVLSVMIESMALGALGALLGGAVAFVMFNGYQASTLNFMSFSQVAFKFAVTPGLVITATVYSLLLGLIGGIGPAVRSARMPIASALREA